MDTSPACTAISVEDDGAVAKRADSDHDMEEGSDGNWDNVASGSGGYGGDDDVSGDDDDPAKDDEDDDDGSGDDDDEDDDEDDEERDLIILCSMSLGRWERYEQAVEAAAEAESGKQVLSSTQGLAAKRQIFNPREAFSMLSRELLDFLRARHVDCSVETGGDDLYHWIVDLGSFSESSALAKDLREVSRRYCYSTVRLRVRFMRGLHPFFPPSVEIVWPHFVGPLLGAVASHPMLQLENWDPWRPAMDTIGQIKAFLETNACVDLDNPANDIRRHPNSTYSTLERGLARLEALSGVAPTCIQQPDIAELYAARDSYDKDAARLQALAEAGKKRGRSEPAGAKRAREVVWARGTGYGSGHDRNGEQWDAKATEAAQRARDSEIQALLDDLYCSLVRELGPRPLLPQEVEDQQQQQQQQQPHHGPQGRAKQQQRQGQGGEGKALVGGRGGVSDAAAAAAASRGGGDGGGGGGVSAAAGDDKGGGSADEAEAMEGVETAASASAGSGMAATQETAAAAAADPSTAAATTTTAAAAAAAAAYTTATAEVAASGSGGSGGGSDGAMDTADTEPRLGPERCAAVLRDSCLVPFIVRELHMASFADMGARHKYYSALLVVLRELCRPGTQDLLWMETDQGQQRQQQQHPQGPTGATAAAAATSSSSSGWCTNQGRSSTGRSVAATITSGLRSAAKMYLNVLGPATVQTDKVPPSGPSVSAVLPFAVRAPDKAESATREAEATQRMAKIIMQLALYLDANMATMTAAAQPPPQPPLPLAAGAAGDAVASAAAAAAAAQSRQGQEDATAANAAAAGAAADGERAASGAQASTSAGGSATGPSLYVATLKPLLVDTVSGLGRAHHYASNSRSEQHAPRTRAVRLAKEVASLESLLPLSESSSVFVRVDETAVQLWKVIVVGPEDTPYSGGCFVFDLYFPPQYPNVPPQVHLLTTGGGRVRFNPNLYAEGKVCLSLLGTWSGDRGETWNADISTAVQVLISIQSLILVPEPYFNEPSYESQTGDRGKAASQEYNKNVRENCVRYAMLDVLRHPPAALADIVRTHFRLRRDALLTQIQGWADEAQATDPSAAGRLLDMRRDLESLMAAL